MDADASANGDSDTLAADNDSVSDDTMASDTATDYAMADDDVPAKATPGKVTKKPAVDDMADDVPADDMAADTAMADDVPADTDTAMADDTAMPDDSAETAGANLPGDDVAAPDEVVAVPVGPKDGVHYSADQVASTAAAVREAGAAFKAATDKAAVGKAKNAYYRKLYELAEFATFNDDPAGSGQQAADAIVLTDTVVDAARFKEVGMAAGKWLEKVQGKEHQGIVLSGSVQDVAKRGQVYETHVLLSDGNGAVSVLMRRSQP